MAKIGIVILAAGGSRRMGSPKQLLDIEGQSLIRRTAELVIAASKTSPVVLVIGANKPQIVPEIADLPLTIIDNSLWEQGLSSSVKMGMAGVWMIDKSIDAILFLVCDQPYLSLETITKMIEVYQTQKSSIVACSYGGELGVPMLFDRKYFDELLSLTGDKGAKPVLMKHLDQAHIVDFELGKIDLDTPEDYENWLFKSK